MIPTSRRKRPGFPQSLAVLTLALAGMVATAVDGQEMVSEAGWRRGYNGLTMICRANGLVAEPLSRWDGREPGETVLAILGSSSEMPVNLEQYLASGGRVLCAIDETDMTTLRAIGIRFFNRNWSVRFEQDAFSGWEDCPIVRRLETEHPVTRGLRSLVTNRPAVLSAIGPDGEALGQPLAWLPLLANIRRNQLYMVAVEFRGGGRLLAISDPSMFSNQMLAYGDNAKLASQAMQWLADAPEKRTHLLMWAGGMDHQPSELEQTEVLLPPPTREEILRALGNLPPDKLVEFGNAVATVAEDEGLINEFLSSAANNIYPVHWNRFLLLGAALATSCLLWFGFFSRDSLPDRLVELEKAQQRGDPGLSRSQRRARAAEERAWAARALVDDFLAGLTGSGLRDAPRAMANVRLTQGQRLFERNPVREIRQVARRASQRQSWSARQLRRLETRIRSWEQLQKDGRLVYDAS